MALTLLNFRLAATTNLKVFAIYGTCCLKFQVMNIFSNVQVIFWRFLKKKSIELLNMFRCYLCGTRLFFAKNAHLLWKSQHVYTFLRAPEQTSPHLCLPPYWLRRFYQTEVINIWTLNEEYRYIGNYILKAYSHHNYISCSAAPSGRLSVLLKFDCDF